MKLKVWICGQGAIGSLFGAHCLANNLDTAFIARQPSQQHIQVELLNDTAMMTVQKHNQYSLPLAKTLPIKEKVTLLIITVKAAHVLTALEQVSPYLSQDCHIILSHNGLGTIEKARALILDTQSLYFCTTSFGALRQGDNVIQTGTGESLWSPVHHGKNSKLLSQEELSLVFPGAKESNNLTDILWTKLAVNAVINPITALYDINNGKVNDVQFTELKHKILTELIEVASHCGVELDLQTLTNLVTQVAEKTKNNSSSMRQDIKHARATEIDFINGFIVDKAQDCNVPTPTNRHLWQSIKRLEIESN